MKRTAFFTLLQRTVLIISINWSFAYTCVSLTFHNVPRQLRAGNFLYLHSKSCRCTSKRPFNPATLAGELTTVLLLIRSREIRGTSSVQLDEHPDGSSWMDRRVDKQITTEEGNGKIRACFDPSIYIYSSSFLRSFSLMRVAFLKIGKYLFYLKDRTITSGLSRDLSIQRLTKSLF